MRSLGGKVAIVTGAGRGLGRAHALALATAGSAVVVNDAGVARDGSATDATPAEAVVCEIEAAGGRAIVSRADCATWDGAASLVETAVKAFGRLDILVNNAGILRDRMSFNMSEQEFDAVVRVHLKGHFATAHHAAVYWRTLAKAGNPVDARIVNTTSEAGLYGTPGQVNYGSAKAGIAVMTIALARELGPIGVTVNAVSPRAITRFTEGVVGATQTAPDAVSPLVVYLAGPAGANITGQVFVVYGGRIEWMAPWRAGAVYEQEVSFTDSDIGAAVETLFARGASRIPCQLPS